jgi:spore coat polysaccharide biosynthesis protein SpsF
LVKIIGVIQARMGSERLPGKVLAPLIQRESILSTLVTRIETSDIEWWVATTDNPEDDLIESWAKHLGLQVFRGSEKNVLSRFTAIAKISGAKWIVRVTADDPFMFSDEIKQLIQMTKSARESTHLICDNPRNRFYPLGYCPEIVRADALIKVEELILENQSFHRSHVTSFLRESSEYIELREEIRHPEYRWTIDTNKDLEFAQKIFKKIKNSFATANYLDLLEICRSNPEIVRINADQQQKALSDG